MLIVSGVRIFYNMYFATHGISSCKENAAGCFEHITILHFSITNQLLRSNQISLLPTNHWCSVYVTNRNNLNIRQVYCVYHFRLMSFGVEIGCAFWVGYEYIIMLLLKTIRKPYLMQTETSKQNCNTMNGNLTETKLEC